MLQIRKSNRKKKQQTIEQNKENLDKKYLILSVTVNSIFRYL